VTISEINANDLLVLNIYGNRELISAIFRSRSSAMRQDRNATRIVAQLRIFALLL